MEKFELIENYLSGKLEGTARENFESLLKNDPSLQADVALQKQIIEGIQKARIAQLKSMLNQVPVGSVANAGASIGQVVIGGVVAVSVITGIWWWVKPTSESKPATPVVATEKPIEPPIKKSEPSPVVIEKSTSASPAGVAKVEKQQVTAPTTAGKPVQPKIEVVDPTDELTQTPTTQSNSEKIQEGVAISTIAVATDNTNAKYSFHYQFNAGKLILYGSFDKGLYEILEVHGDVKSLFLFYKDSYYFLDESKRAVTPLSPIRDKQLIQKLRDYRSK